MLPRLIGVRCSGRSGPRAIDVRCSGRSGPWVRARAGWAASVTLACPWVEPRAVSCDGAAACACSRERERRRLRPPRCVRLVPSGLRPQYRGDQLDTGCGRFPALKSGGGSGCGRRRCCGCGSLSVDSSSVLMKLAKGESTPLSACAFARRVSEPRQLSHPSLTTTIPLSLAPFVSSRSPPPSSTLKARGLKSTQTCLFWALNSSVSVARAPACGAACCCLGLSARALRPMW
eukprot:712708-Amphidinium_carterae.2